MVILACGSGIPPEWIHDAAGAEAWAYFFVTRETLDVPRVVTDCKGVLNNLEAGVTIATLPSKRLARVWKMAAHNLDGNFDLASSRTLWMPAHGSAQTIGRARGSNGQAITALMWCANRLADLLAKHAATQHRVPRRVTGGLATMARLVQHSLAKLGVVTQAANHHVITEITSDGSSLASVRVVIARPTGHLAPHDVGAASGSPRSR